MYMYICILNPCIYILPFILIFSFSGVTCTGKSCTVEPGTEVTDNFYLYIYLYIFNLPVT